MHADIWADGNVEDNKMSRYPCAMGSGMLDCGWARCVRKYWEPLSPMGHVLGPMSPEAQDLKFYKPKGGRKFK